MRWNGKNKAVTFSYDDGVISDIRLVELLNRYGLKATFNLNSGLLGTDHRWTCGNFEVCRLPVEGLRQLYAGHEIALHGRLHLHPVGLDEAGMREEMLADKQALEALFGTRIRGMAYAFGEYDPPLVSYLRQMGLGYGRTVEASHSFDIPKDLMTFAPTCHHDDPQVFELVDRFLQSPGDTPQLMYIWGHAYEFDAWNGWERFEQLCRRLSGHGDIYYGTNAGVFLDT